MEWFKWLVVAVFALDVLVSIAKIETSERPIVNGIAAILYLLLACGTVAWL